MQTRIKPTPGVTLSPEEYEDLVLGETDRTWELWDGRLREKPAMSRRHDDASFELGHLLRGQLDPDVYRVSANMAKLKRADRSYFVPDVVVIRVADMVGDPNSPRTVNAHTAPVPLVVEVWSPSTGDYDIEVKHRAYQVRGDLEIWRLHPFERSLTIWRRQADGSYVESVVHGGLISPSTLPGVTIDLEALFVST